MDSDSVSKITLETTPSNTISQTCVIKKNHLQSENRNTLYIPNATLMKKKILFELPPLFSQEKPRFFLKCKWDTLYISFQLVAS